MNLLITGGAGFIGSNFVSYILDKYEDIHIVNFDKLTSAGKLENLKDILSHPRHSFIQGDICDQLLVKKTFEQYQIDGVIHFAAESHVDNSIQNPALFVQTNVLGTFTLLETARKAWMDGIGTYKKQYQKARFHHISTDEVYGTLGINGFFNEDSSYSPNSPYSASKASSDMLVRSYFHTYDMNVISTNCSNNYGPNQHDEKLIPAIIKKALDLEPITIYGDGQNIRDWLYVLDHCFAIEKVFFEGKPGETYLIGGHCEKTNIEIAHTICDFLDRQSPTQINEKGITSYRELIEFVKDRPGHDFRYAIDDSKLRNQLGFQAEYTFEKGIEKTILHYLKLSNEKKFMSNIN
ncbi:dTDP-glucose 4,6-dehydratase [Peribacillus sp. NPDC097206]|uniref:dTDP-glucose 4,6-dehydratase n=1 Tax=unclassified Peribacillus TaxID=2675266 RepID=UPI00382098FD